MKAEILFPFVDPIFCKPLNPVLDRNITYFVILKNVSALDVFLKLKPRKKIQRVHNYNYRCSVSFKSNLHTN